MPMTGQVDGKGQITGLLARVNYMREEPGGDRFFISDQNGALSILDKKTKKLTTYLDFNGRGNRNGLFHRIIFEVGFATGLTAFQFDPDYIHNGRFYTIHMEEPAVNAPMEPDATNFPGLNATGFQVSTPIDPPGIPTRESVLIEWTDTNIHNSTFEGTARELMRVRLNSQIHPLGDMVFNPTAKAGEPDWRVMYLSCGDGGSGESVDPEIRNNPQRLDTVVGKIMRIIPDLDAHKDTSKVSENARYRVPNDNPFVSKQGARPEIWAYGLRNPHRMSWDVDPADPKKNYLFAGVIGLHTWETVVIVHKGANYGYSEREGNQQLQRATNKTGPAPEDDRIPVRIGEQATNEMVKPEYPVIEYGHVADGGDAILGGFVYRGKIAALSGKFLFGDISTGRIWWADPKDMIAADDGDPKTMAPYHEVRLLWAAPDGAGKEEMYSSMAPIASIAYHKRGGQADPLPGTATVSKGRADLRFATDTAGELYLLSKSDGMIREVVGVTEK